MAPVVIIIVRRAHTTMTTLNTQKTNIIINITRKMNVQTNTIMSTIIMIRMGTMGENLVTMIRILTKIKLTKGVNLFTLNSTLTIINHIKLISFMIKTLTI